METKAKALELVKKFLPRVYCYMGSGMLSNTYDDDVALTNARVCAMDAADEVRKALWEAGVRGSSIDFWVAVKDAAVSLTEYPAE